jgi:hypothetical protein
MSTTPQPSHWFTGRTKIATIASIVAVVMSGAVAVGANTGILNAASDNSVGALSAAGDLTVPNTQVVDVYLDTTSTTPTVVPTTGAPIITSPAATVQQFAVDEAGTVSVSQSAQGLLLDGVVANPGWTWSMLQPNAESLTVVLTNGTRTLQFVASLAADGTIAAEVNEPITAGTPPAANNSGQVTVNHSSDDDDNEYEGGGDDD